jgi:hypothetical protein
MNNYIFVLWDDELETFYLSKYFIIQTSKDQAIKTAIKLNQKYFSKGVPSYHQTSDNEIFCIMHSIKTYLTNKIIDLNSPLTFEPLEDFYYPLKIS